MFKFTISSHKNLVSSNTNPNFSPLSSIGLRDEKKVRKDEVLVLGSSYRGGTGLERGEGLSSRSWDEKCHL